MLGHKGLHSLPDITKHLQALCWALGHGRDQINDMPVLVGWPSVQTGEVRDNSQQ